MVVPVVVLVVVALHNSFRIPITTRNVVSGIADLHDVDCILTPNEVALCSLVA